MSTTDPHFPVFDLRKLARREVEGLARACGEPGLFYVENHGVDVTEIEALARLSRAFFAWGLERKLALRMELGGRAWRGYFPLGRELTSGQPDGKEGLYFGQQLSDDDPRVRASTPLHGSNLYPALAGFAERVEGYMTQLERVGQTLLRAIAQSLGLRDDAFERRISADPLLLFRIFHYPGDSKTTFGVGAHSDYGLLTLLWQDGIGGLQVLPPNSQHWIDAPPRPGTFVCNLGDMMERLTGARCHSITHRVTTPVGENRIAMPFFMDPGFDTELDPLLPPAGDISEDARRRWDGEDVHAFEGTYGDYLLGKVGRVFPHLRDNVL